MKTAPESYPELPGWKSTDTSREAARSTPASVIQSRIILAFRTAKQRNGFTADEMAATLNESILTIRPRFSELRLKGEIIDTKIRRKNRSGKSAIVWALSNRRP